MDDEKPPLTDALRRLAEQKRRSLTGHPTPQELASYHAGELPPEAEARLREHLAVCRECSDLLLDLAGFADLKPPEGVPELTDDEVEQDWQALRARMGKPAEVVPFRPQAVPRRKWFDSPLLPVAASLLAVLGFSFGLYQSAQVGKLSKPSLSRVLTLDSTVRGEPEESRKISSENPAEIVMPPLDEHPSYRVEILDNDRVLWSDTFPGSVEDLSIDIPKNFLRPGSYKIRISGGERGREASPIEYDLEVE